MPAEPSDALIVGGGPAGLRAAELLSAAGHRTVLADQMPSVGRKFLVAGRGGLNLTHSETLESFQRRYGAPQERWQELLRDFSPQDLRLWAHGLGIETFVGTSGRIFPLSKQAAPLLRRWLKRLREQNVHFVLRHRLTEFRREDAGWQVTFETPTGPVSLETSALILALGGASWPQTGSDGQWLSLLREGSVDVHALLPANCGYEVEWPPDFLARAEGLPLKNITVSAGEEKVSGELLVTRYGLEGGALYQLGPRLRAMPKPEIVIDLKPSSSVADLLSKAAGVTPLTWSTLARTWRLSPVAVHLLESHSPITSVQDAAEAVKSFRLALRGPRPIAEAISSAGGVAWNELTRDLMLQRHPGIFCAGEMIDWEAPTGGYLLQGCFATGTRAAQGAINFLQSAQSR